jgi:hypothetical protein
MVKRQFISQTPTEDAQGQAQEGKATEETELPRFAQVVHSRHTKLASPGSVIGNNLNTDPKIQLPTADHISFDTTTPPRDACLSQKTEWYKTMATKSPLLEGLIVTSSVLRAMYIIDFFVLIDQPRNISASRTATVQ